MDIIKKIEILNQKKERESYDSPLSILTPELTKKIEITDKKASNEMVIEHYTKQDLSKLEIKSENKLQNKTEKSSLDSKRIAESKQSTEKKDMEGFREISLDHLASFSLYNEDKDKKSE